MPDPEFQPIQPARLEWQGAIPVASDYADAYFSRSGGVDESRLVFLRGNSLQQRFAGLRAGEIFVIGETGFGTGLNCLLAAELFLRLAPPGAILHLVSAEAHPLTRTDLARALGHWPELAPLAAPLREGYPPPAPGFHRVRLAENVDLTLMLGDAVAMWGQSECQADAWFLDGFAPARNPAMWSAELFGALARRSRPGATLGTFTVAGAVRSRLAGIGFKVFRRPGFGAKRQRLEGRAAGDWKPQRTRAGTALVAGAGLAGAATARALADRSWKVTVVDSQGIAGGASGIRAGVLHTTPSAHLTPQNRFYLGSYIHTLRWLSRLGFPDSGRHGRLNGVIQHLVDARQRRKVHEAMASGAWPPELLAPAGERSVELKGAGFLAPAEWCRRLLDHPGIRLRRAAVAEPVSGPCAGVVLADGERVEADAVILCTGVASRPLPGLEWLPLKRIRGQVSYCAATPRSSRWRQAECHTGYLTPALDGVHCIGATFNLHESCPSARAEDDRSNLDLLRRSLPSRWRELGGEHIEVRGSRVGFRCQSRDFLPLCGAAPWPGGNSAGQTFLNIAHGSRGITNSPLCADLIADCISGLPLPVDRTLAQALAPARFQPVPVEKSG